MSPVIVRTTLAVLLLILAGCSSQPPSNNATPPAISAHALLTFEQQWRGVPYRYGGTTRRGVDCSGFVQLTFQKLANIQLPRTTDEQVERGYEIPLSQVRSGDLLFFKTGWVTRHVGIYIGEQNFVHASTNEGVTISSLNTPYWHDAFWQARRVNLTP